MTTANLSPRKHKLTRVGIELGIAFLGVMIAVADKLLFDRRIEAMEASHGPLPTVKDDYNLFFMLSNAACAVLLLLTVLSALTYLFQRNVSRFQRLTVSVSPVICSCAIFAISLFYAYLTSGGTVSIAADVVMLGIGQAMVFRLPCALSRLFTGTKREKK